MKINSSNFISIKEFCEKFKITNSTFKNWCKTRIINSDECLKDKISVTEVKKLQDEITSGKLDKLQKRANKKHNKQNLIPKESLLNFPIDIDFRLFLNYDDFNFESLKLFILINIVYFNNIQNLNYLCIDKIFKIKGYSVFNCEIKRFLPECFYNLLPSNQNEYIALILIFNYFPVGYFKINPIDFDYWGILLQFITKEGDRATKGAYYTPTFIIENMVNSSLSILLKQDKENLIITDPCCGSGRFLISCYHFIKKTKSDKKICFYANDLDREALYICNIKMELLKINDNKITFFTINDDFITSKFDFKSDLFITNPPWGAHLEKDVVSSYKNLFSDIKSKEIFSYFLLKCICNLNSSGIINFLLPESIFTVKKHQDIRKEFIKNDNVSIAKIVKYDKVFHKVFSNVVNIELYKDKIDYLVIEEYQTKLLKKIQHNKIFNYNRLFLNDEERKILTKLDNYSFKIKNLDTITFGMGIVTGNNKKFVIKNNNGNTLKGADIGTINYKKATHFLNIKDDYESYQQKRSLQEYFVKSKLIYRFIYSYPIVSIDYDSNLILNSCNYIISRDSVFTNEILCIILNSSLIKYYFLNSYKTVKVLREHVLNIPLPNVEITIKYKMKFILLFNQFRSGNSPVVLEKIDTLLFQIYEFTISEISIIKSSLEKLNKQNF